MVEHKKLVIIPAFNEEQSIIGQYNEVRDKAGTFDVLVINDCSKDLTHRLCVDNRVKVLDLAVNLGIGGAMQTGYRYAWLNGYDIAVQIDGDGQHDPAYLNMMYDMLVSNEADMVIGSRFIDKEGYQSTPLRRLGIGYFSALIRLLTGHMVTDPTSGLRMVGRKLIEEFASDYPQDYPEPESTVRLLLHGYKTVEVPVRMRRRSGGRSSIHPVASVYYMIKVTIAIVLERMRK
ncbi:MAG: glycosyltransferase family 2 protein [Lachnospiraceae bacterium]|nr:glycosyltransferase family 2 protein [Lachnospiraceae bacterium]